MPSPRVLVPILAAATLAACADHTTAPPTVDPVADESEIPSRSQQRAGTFADAAPDELWRVVAAADGRAVVGLKAPNAVRGVYRGQILMNMAQRIQARNAVLSLPGVEVLHEDDLLPVLEIRVRNSDALRSLRTLDMVDYIEPAIVEQDLPQWAGVGGCGWGSSWSGDRQHTGEGDVYSEKWTAMGIPSAWSYSSGSGVTIGLTDTGISSQQQQMGDQFTHGLSGNRWLRLTKISSKSSVYDECGHGTRMAGIIAAPRDGRSVAGVAWGANFVSVRQADGVAAVSSSDAKYSVRTAVQNGSQIVVMAWESLNWWWQVSDEIEYWHYRRPVLFLGAAGTSGCGDLIWDDNVVFPADMEEVVAVTGVSYPNGGVPCGIHYGKQVELTAYLDVPSTGLGTADVVGMGGSSNATAVMGGIAALTWSRNPGLTRDQLRQRLRESASYYPNRSDREGYGLVSALKAVRGY